MASVNQTIFSIIIGSFLAITLAWYFAPIIANLFARSLGHTGISISLLLMDMALSFLFFFLSSLLSVNLAKSRPYIASFAVSVIGTSIYLIEVGGFKGMYFSRYPLWYEFFPTHFLASWAALYFTNTNNKVS